MLARVIRHPTAPDDRLIHVPNPRFRAAAASGLLVLSLGLAACGSDDGSDGIAGAGMEAVTVEGAFGKKAKVTIKERLGADEPEVTVLRQGKGDPVATGDTALIHWWVGNGHTRKEALNAFGGAPTAVQLGDEIFPGLMQAIEDQPVGSRVAVLAQAKDAFGELGHPELGIGNKDTTLIVVDVVGSILPGPRGADRPPAKWAPTLQEEDGVVTGLDFTDAHQPKGALLHTTLVRGDGDRVKKGQTIYVNYLGQIPGQAKPFDESFSKQPANFKIGVGKVIDAWDEVLVGRAIGSRMIIEVPPAKGYGDKGEPSAGIKGDSTLFFVVDILGAN